MERKKKPCPTCGRERILWNRKHGCQECTNKAKAGQKPDPSLRRSGFKRRSSPMRKVSRKRAEQVRKYGPKKLKFVEENETCQAQATPECLYWTNDIHHKAGSDNDRFLDDKDWMAVCRLCHDYIHENPAESYKKGWMIRKRQKK